MFKKGVYFFIIFIYNENIKVKRKEMKMKKVNSYEEVKVRNAHAALDTARKNFYKSPANRTRQFTLTFVDFLPEEMRAKYSKKEA